MVRKFDAVQAVTQPESDTFTLRHAWLRRTSGYAAAFSLFFNVVTKWEVRSVDDRMNSCICMHVGGKNNIDDAIKTRSWHIRQTTNHAKARVLVDELPYYDWT